MKLYNKQQTKDFRRKLRKDQTPQEFTLWSLVRNRKILDLKFFRQYSVGIYILDLYAPAIRLAIEADGGQHSQSLSDEKRTEYLNSLGIEVLRFWNNDVDNNLEGVYEKLYQVIQNKLNSPQPSL